MFSETAYAEQHHATYIPLSRFRVMLVNHDGSSLQFPLQTISAEDALRALELDRFLVDSWTNRWVRSERRKTLLPSVMRLKKMVTPVRLEATASLSLRSLFMRDGGVCRYTREPLRLHSPNPNTHATIDHIVPLGQGGDNAWHNVVLASQAFNQMKGCRTPEQMGVKTPEAHAPTNADLLKVWLSDERFNTVPPDWRELIKANA